MRNLQCVVVGTGRCGTVFMSRLLTSLGIPCGHESIFDIGGMPAAIRRLDGEEPLGLSVISKLKFSSCLEEVEIDQSPWLSDIEDIVADSSYMAAPHLDHTYLDGAKFIHVVRHPLKVINSFVNNLGYFYENEPSSLYGKAWEEYIYRYVPDLYDDVGHVERATMYYVRWNAMIERRLRGRDCVRIRIEDDLTAVMKYLDRYSDSPFNDRTINGIVGDQRRIGSQDLPRTSIGKDLSAMMVRYGY